MKKISKSFAGLAFAGVAVCLLASSCQRNGVVETETITSQSEMDIPPAGTPVPGRYIVVLEDDASIASIDNYDVATDRMKLNAAGLLGKYNIGADKIDHVYSNVLQGFSANLSIDEYSRLVKDARVKYIEQDTYVSLLANDGKSTEITAQTVPYGIARVGSADGTGKVAWIIDTGIQLNHPDLNVDANRSKSFLSGGGSNKSANDQNGHGTHVAGTVAAKNNTEGVIGVAWNATVIAVRVLDRNGSGTTSGVIQGVDYVGANGKAGDAANMSLGGGASSTLDNAVINASNKGIFFALAAGNSSADANNSSPARANGSFIYTVSAIDINDVFASFSNFGNPPIDFAAPGVSVTSTWIGSGYRTISGTSMASPHICGVLLLRQGSPATSGFAINDPDGNPDPIGVR